ncbi:MAG: hypothetical protein R6V32_11960 [Bacteroidales bacterium]
MKNLMSILTLAGLFFFLSPVLNAQEQSNGDNEETESQIEQYKHGIGAAAGFTTGYGLSYRYYYDRFVFQGTFAPMVESSKNMTFSSGLTFMYRLVDTEHTNLYLYESNHWHHDKNINDNDYYYNDPYSRYSENINHNIYIGFGTGFELMLWKRVSLNIMVGYAYIHGIHKSEEIITTFDGEIIEENSNNYKTNKIHPSIEGGLYFCF